MAAAVLTAAIVAGCGDGGTSPPDGNEGDRIAARFEQLADSVDGEGWSPTAEALRHAAEIVRLAGGATPVTLTIDGDARDFLAVSEQIDFPNIVCSWPDSTVVPGDSAGTPGPEPASPEGGGECEEVGTWSMRTLIAWEPETMAEVVRVVADLGNTEVQPGVPDVMSGLPTSSGSADGSPPSPETPDSAVGEFPGFMGEYLVGDHGMFYAVEGTQSNDLVTSGGSCTEDVATIDWARFSCRAARVRFAVDMRVDQLRIDPFPVPEGQGESHTIAMGSTEIDGVQLEVVEWTPPPVDTVPPLPPVDTFPVPPPVDTVPLPPPVDTVPAPPPGDSAVAPTARLSP